MNLFKHNKKANAFAWLSALGALFIIALTYLTLTPAFDQVYNATGNYTGWDNYNSTRAKLVTSWSLWPAIALLGIIVFALVQTLRNDPYGGYR